MDATTSALHSDRVDINRLLASFDRDASLQDLRGGTPAQSLFLAVPMRQHGQDMELATPTDIAGRPAQGDPADASTPAQPVSLGSVS